MPGAMTRLEQLFAGIFIGRDALPRAAEEEIRSALALVVEEAKAVGAAEGRATLRDQFAMAALPFVSASTMAESARLAYEYADAMLGARVQG